MFFRTPWDPDPEPDQIAPLPAAPPKPKRRGRPPRSTRPLASVAGTTPDWLYHHLTAFGPAADVAGFAAAARGPGVIPWRRDFTRLEEDVFHLAVGQPVELRRLSVTGSRLLARQFSARAEAHHDRALGLIGSSRTCPLDLHVLLPVPPAILELGGPAHPAALAWLRAHWGIPEPPRRVVERPDATAGRRLPRRHAVIGYGFFTAGETPTAAVHYLVPRWPTLRFVLRVRPAD
jgi:hypothetical protein